MIRIQVSLLKRSTYNSVQFDSKYGVGIAVITDLSALLEVAHFQLPGGGETNHCHQTATEQPLHDTNVFRTCINNNQVL
jgi:hypothetical protein